MTINPKYIPADNELMLLLNQGDREAFHEIYNRYWCKLYGLAFGKLKSSDEAEDIVQELFLSLWMKRETLIIQSSLYAYLYSALKYKIINHIAANIVKRNYLKTLDKAVFDHDNATSDLIACNEAEKWINSGIKKLSPKVKEVFELSRKQHLSINEISVKLNVSDQTVKNQISKALKMLKVHLNNISISLVILLSFNI